MVDPIPMSVRFPAYTANTSSVKTFDGSNLVNYQESTIPQEMITDLLYEDVGGIELINFSRHDIIDGTPVVYTLIGNIPEIEMMFNSNNIISGFANKDNHFSQYTIDIGLRLESVEFDADGNLVIDFSEIGPDENVEVQILSDGILYLE